MRRAALSVVVAGLSALLSLGCGKKKEDEGPIPPPPPPGQASRDELSTALGQAKGLDEALAPTSAKWTRVFALDEKRAVITGDVVNETVALITDDAGTTWRSFRNERDAWSSWNVGLDGAVVLGLGSRDGAPTPQSAKVEAARVAFATIDAPTIGAATPFFPTPKGPVTGLVQTVSAVPALVSADMAGLVIEEGPRKTSIVYGGKPGADAVPPNKLPAGEKIVPVPYGRGPVMLSIKGRDLLQRPFPVPNKPLEKPQKVVNVTATPTLLADLSVPPLCDTGVWSFQRIQLAPKKLGILGVSPTRTVSFALPESTVPTTAVGCGAKHVVIEAIQAKTGPPALQAEQPDVPILLTCDLAGKCTSPKNAPFRMWPGPQKREIAMASTAAGTIGVMSVRAGDRWGLYLAQSPDGTTFERPRVIGEGTGDRGRIELGALVSLGKRALLIISADVTGTSRRGWFVLVSDDGGTNWNPP
ncbi:MAG: sialidase family protein [Minicystis sp.]